MNTRTTAICLQYAEMLLQRFEVLKSCMTKFVLMILFLSRVANIEYRFTVVHLVNTLCRKSKTRKDYDLERCTHYVLLIKME